MADDSGRPPPRKRHVWLRYTAAVCFGLVALALRAAFDKVLDDAHPFPFFIAAVAVAGWYGGIGPALFALTLGYLAADWFFIAPRHQFIEGSGPEFYSMMAYAFTGLVVGLAVNAAQGATRRERHRAAQLREERERFRVTLSSIGDAVIATDARNRVIFMNAVAEKLVVVRTVPLPKNSPAGQSSRCLNSHCKSVFKFVMS